MGQLMTQLAHPIPLKKDTCMEHEGNIMVPFIGEMFLLDRHVGFCSPLPTHMAPEAVIYKSYRTRPN